MKTLIKSLVFVLSASLFMGLASPALAYYPSLSVYSSGNDNATISITGAQPNSTVSLSYTASGSNLATTISNLGYTNYSGSFSQSVSANAYGFSSGSQIYVTVAGEQSNTVSYNYNNGGNGCNYNCGSNTNVTLSQTSLSLNQGQSQTISIYGSSYNNYYVSSNTNSSVATASLSGSTLTVYGNSNGSTTMTICQNGNSWACATLYVTVNGNNGGNCYYASDCNGNISLSQSTLFLNQGQNSTVTVYNNNNYSNSYYIFSNSNSNVATAYFSGNTLYVSANTSGSTSIRVCANGSSNSCATLYVTVNGSNNGNGSVSLSQSSISMTSGQSSTVSIYGNGSYYLNANSNASVVTANVNGSVLNLYALSSGTSNLSVCAYGASQCANLYVTVSGGSGSISFSQSTVNLSSGQSQAIYVYGNGNNNFYISSNSNPSVVSASLNGSQINLYASNSGNSTITVCQSGSYNACGTVYITVNGSNSGGGLYFSSTSLPGMTLGQYYSYQLQVNGGTWPYYYTVTSGNLPNGLTLSSNGLISGTPYNSSNTSFTIRVNDNYGRSASMNFNISGGGVLGATTFQNGSLISENGTVYITYKNMKTAFANASAFTGLGYSFSNVMSVGYTNLSNSGYIVSSSNVQHPWGSWIKNGSTVYFVHQNGLIPVTDWNTFINNGGRDSLVVPANWYDMRLNMLSPMSWSDSRLQ